MRYAALIALSLSVGLSSCAPERLRGGGGSGGDDGTGGSSTGGATGTGGKATGGATGTGGASSTGGATGTGGSSSTGGATGTGGSSSTGGASGEKMDAASAWPNCLEPVFSGVMPAEFCMVYAKVCTFTGTNHYSSMADCMSKFRGGSSDGDACKSGHLCRAATNPSMKEADCASSGTGSCKN